ncbi:hypothetical protein GCM10010361_33050 [Streptomyces olivaceiscleroticus]|uniref:Uncharacterized protein n=1 Tax=Streptomyces olivaceiscleroticus TaxID=68245 RepID=A0ABN1A315_9ACTN
MVRPKDVTAGTSLVDSPNISSHHKRTISGHHKRTISGHHKRSTSGHHKGTASGHHKGTASGHHKGTASGHHRWAPATTSAPSTCLGSGPPGRAHDPVRRGSTEMGHRNAHRPAGIHRQGF